MAFQNIDLEALLRDDSELPTDVTFQVYDNDSVLVQDISDSYDMNIDTSKIFKAHKFLLAAVSPMFRRQFFGSLPQTGQPVWVGRTSSKAFGIMLNFLYQKAGLFAFPCGHFACLFEVKNLGEKYQITDLVQKTDLEIANRQLTHENLIEAAKSAKSFHHIFPDISDRLMVRCRSFFMDNYKTLEKIRILLNDHNDSQIDTDIIVMLIKSKPITCDGCKQTSAMCLNGKGVNSSNVHITRMRGAKVIRDMGSERAQERTLESQGVGVITRRVHILYPHFSDMLDVLWENGVENMWNISDEGWLVFKCD